jgi:hypothetical protein
MDYILSDGMGSCTLHCDIFCAVVRLHTTVTVLGPCRSGRASREVPEAGHTAIVLQHQWYHEVSIAAKVQTLCRYADLCSAASSKISPYTSCQCSLSGSCRCHEGKRLLYVLFFASGWSQLQLAVYASTTCYSFPTRQISGTIWPTR